MPRSLALIWRIRESFAATPSAQDRMNWADLLGLLDKHTCLSIFGQKGGGKSALMFWLLKGLTYYSDNLIKINSGTGVGECVPFCISATDFPMNKISDWDSLWCAYMDDNKEKLGDLLVNDEELINRVFASGQALLMIDWLDDVVDRHARETLDLAIIEGLNRYPLCKCLMGFRLYHNSIWPRQTNRIDMVSVYLEPFNRMDAQEFIDSFCIKGFDGSAKPNLSDSFKDAFSMGSDLPAMASSPVLLNMMCYAYSRSY